MHSIKQFNHRSPIFVGAIIILLIVFIIIQLINPRVKTEIIEKEVVIEKEVLVEVEPTYAYKITSKEREMLARLVYREANVESLECQKAVVSVVINRWQNGYWGNTLDDVVYSENQFSPAHLIPQTTPTEINYEAVDYVLKNGCTIPNYVLYFRADYHFKWSGYVPYQQIDNTYFGYQSKDKNN